MYKLIFFISLLLLASCAYGPSSDTISKNESNLTPGMITTKIEKGKTSQSQVLEIFGPPDLVTKENDVEMWGYDRISRETAYGAFGIGVLAGGAPGGSLVGGIGTAKKGYTTQTTKTVFLLIYFKDNTVVEYKLSATKF
jgi:outer membrane protein assembly factor BamE (lipoprotein component of BamABCDE complex)